MRRQHTLLPLLALALAAAPAVAQPAPQPAAGEYEVRIRYQIEAFRNERVRQFFPMLSYLEGLGFRKDPGPEDEAENPQVNRMTGAIGSRAAALKLLGERHVRGILLVPRDAKMPEEKDPVRVDLILTGGPTPDQLRLLAGLDRGTPEELAAAAGMVARQRVLAEQTLAALKDLGFREGVGYDDRGHTRIVGMVSVGQLDALLGDLAFSPAGVKLFKQALADNPDLYRAGIDLLDPVLDAAHHQSGGTTVMKKVREDLGRNPEGANLSIEGFVQVLESLKADLRRHPGGIDLLDRFSDTLHRSPLGIDLLAQMLAQLRRSPAVVDLPILLKREAPVRVGDVLPEVPYPKERPLPLIPPKGQEALTPELRALLADEAEAAKPRRMEVILSETPSPDDVEWQRNLRAVVPELAIEGRLGPLVTVTAPPAQMPALAAQPQVSTIRLPRSAQPRMIPVPANPGGAQEALHATGLDRLHALGRRGKGFRIAIIDGDFRGWEGLVGKELPAGTQYLDLTAERNRTLLPDPFPGDPQGRGHGTQCAAAAALAAPEARLVLIRIDPSAPYEMQAVARFINGESYRSEAMERRASELDEDRADLDNRREQLLVERRKLLETIGPFDEFEPKWKAYKTKQDQFDKEEQDYRGRTSRYLQLLLDLRGLRGLNIVATALVWNEGFPVDGSSALSRYFDDRPFRATMWFQAAGNTRGQSWSGPFLDTDGNGVVEFGPVGTRLKEGRWSRELNALAWQPAAQPDAADLPANATVRVSIQWREPHDPEFLRNGEDVYREPLANLQLVLLRQLDPTGTKQPVDDLEVVAQSVGIPQRIDNQPSSATYEQTVEFTVKDPGRYFVRVEGKKFPGIRPPSVPTLPIMEKTWELRPRVFVETLAGDGRALFQDYAPAAGGLGMPADAERVFTIGAANRLNQPEPYSASGPPHNLLLLPKPELLAYDELGGDGGPCAYGTSISTSFAAGLAASSLSAGAPLLKFLETVQRGPGSVLRVPGR
jgi:hypothetical protein